MKIGYLHIGSPQHGVCRYGRILAAEARNQPELTVIEVSLTLTKSWSENRRILTEVAQKLSAADLVHLQYSYRNNRELWGRGWLLWHSLRTFVSHCSSPLVVTLHDVYIAPIQKAIASSTNKPALAASIFTKLMTKNLPKKVLVWLRSLYISKIVLKIEAFLLSWLLKQVQLIFVCSELERQQLKNVTAPRKVVKIPHFVEKRELNINKEAACQALGLDANQKIITLLGFIHVRKGHQLLVASMSKLPQDIQVILAGSASPHPSAQQFLAQILSLAKAEGIDDRLRVTGYLPEKELELYLAATDLAICPFKHFSASGSLSTWISVARPILAFELPQIAEYNSFEPEAIKTFQPYTSKALAQAIKNYFHKKQETFDPAVARLQKQLSITVIFDKHLSKYCSVMGKLNNI